ncbi:MAG: carboxypeptidase regulatory-like domain-containing protein [Terriglobales bacterium]|jgi:hypothetical protein
MTIPLQDQKLSAPSASKFKSRMLATMRVSALMILAVSFVPSAIGQGTGATGSIQGTVTDPSGAVVANATVKITSRATNRTHAVTTTSSGAYNSGALIPGEYVVEASGIGLSPVTLPVVVQVGVTSNGNIKLGIQAQNTVVNVEDTAVRVNTDQATVQGVLTAQQIDNLPINGRNFLDLAQLEPGVQIQDGSNFDPTKGGFSGISIGGRSGRTTRIELDGLDITDETVGTTVTNVSAGAIQEFNISQSTLDLSSELSSSGVVNVSTRTGTNSYHGEGFYLFRDRRLAAAFPGGQDSPYQRNHFGGRFGGPIIKDHLFFFLDGERIKQDLGVPVQLASPFQSLSGVASEPLREKEGLARADWQITSSMHAFYRLNYDNLTDASNTLINYSVYNNLNNTPAHAAGLDFNTGSFTHSIRFGYTKFQNHIGDATGGGGLPVPIPGAQVRVSSYRAGANPLAPQATFQSNKQIKYDGSKLLGSHILRYGVDFNKILGGGFANFFGLAPSIRSSTSSARQKIAAAGPFPGGASNPLNYPISQIVLGNGQGFFTEAPAFGFPSGGQFDNRFQWYLGDTWKIRPNLTFNYGLRYVRDTGRTNSDLAPLPCSDIDAANFNPPPPCSGNMLDLFGKGLGGKVRQDNNNFSPTVGIAWDPSSSGKTVFRAGGGVYYENAIFNNVLFSRPLLLKNGLFNATPVLCPANTLIFPGGQAVTSTPGGLDIATQVCGQPIGSVAQQVIALQNQFIAATAKAGAQANPQFAGETLELNGLLAPDYRSPYSFQMNAGIQRQLWNGGVLSADYIRNVNLHYLLGIDSNHVGASRFLNKTAATNAITATNASFGCPAGAAGIDCAIAQGATMEDYAGNGIGSAAEVFGASSNAVGLPPDQGAAFAGVNPLVGQNIMYFPVGRSVYNALQIALRSNSANPFPNMAFVRHVNLQVSYALSKFASGTSGDQDFIGGGFDYDSPNRYLGWSEFDRTHQFSVGTTVDFPGALKVSLIGHVYSPLSSSLWVPSQGRAGEIFNTDFTGDGTVQDPIPGTVNGAFGRDIKPGDLSKVISNYNSTVAGKPTPAGQALISAGLFTQAQLVSLGGVADTLDPTQFVSDPAGNGWLKVVDLKTSFPIKIRERFTIEPSAAVYNLFNFVNYNISPSTTLGNILDGSNGSVGGTPTNDPRNQFRATQTSSTFALGSPRQIEFGLRITF